MGKITALSDADYQTVGRRHGSGDVALESSEACSRWKRDQAVLAGYGHGAASLAAFEALRAGHEEIRKKRPEAVAAKTLVVQGRDGAVSGGWAWVDKVTSVLGARSRSDEALAARLNAAAPPNDAGLDAGIGALAKLLEEHKAALPADAEVDARIAEAPAIRAAISAAPGTVATAKSAPIADTAELDLADGKLYVMMADLNKAARKAIRNGTLAAKATEYRFHHLKRSGNTAPQEPTK